MIRKKGGRKVGKKCEICNKRKPKYPVVVHPSYREERVVEMCWACNRKYMQLRTRFLVRAYAELNALFEGTI